MRQEIAVGQQQVPGAEPAQQPPGQRLLPGRQRRQLGAQHRPGPAFPQSHHPHLGERPAAGVVARVAELRGVLRGVRQVQAHPADSRQPHPGHERRLLVLPGQTARLTPLTRIVFWLMPAPTLT